MVLWCSQPKHARVICGTRWTSTVHSSLEDRLKVHFNKVMQNDNIPLFKDFEVYKSSLPVRREDTTGDQVPLYKLPHWTVENDMKSLAYQLEKPTHLRAKVKYLCAPGSSGKTSCILPAFLKSTENEKDGFTHYLYLAFSNNDSNFFQVSKSSKITNDAESQGASFIFECLKILLELPGKQGPHLVPVDKHAKLTEFLKRLWATLLLRLGIKLTENGLINLHKRVNIETMTLLKNFQSMAHIENTHAKLTEFLKKIAGPSKRLRILLHLDEHRKMCDRNEDNVDEAYKGAMFSKGALQALASVPEVTVIATYTKRPPLPAHASSTVCCYPVTFLCLNVEAAMQEVEELHFPHSQCRFDQEQKRLWATLLLRLGIKLTENGLINLHKRVNIETMTLLKNFQSMAHIENTTEALKKCIELCAIKLPKPFSNLNAAMMLARVQPSICATRVPMDQQEQKSSHFSYYT